MYHPSTTHERKRRLPRRVGLPARLKCRPPALRPQLDRPCALDCCCLLICWAVTPTTLRLSRKKSSTQRNHIKGAIAPKSPALRRRSWSYQVRSPVQP